MKINILSINDNALKIKSIIEALTLIQVLMDNDDIVHACLDGTRDKNINSKLFMNTIKNILNPIKLISILVFEKKTCCSKILLDCKELSPVLFSSIINIETKSAKLRKFFLVWIDVANVLY